MAQGIVLAGGFSSRAKTNKMHLIVDGKPLLCHTIDSLKPFTNKIIVVTGHYDKDIRSFIKEDEQVHIIFNEKYEQGMFSSVLKGVSEINEDFFVIPGDIPFIKKETYQALLKGSKPVRFPTFKGKEGHPLFISKDLIPELLNEPITSNLKVFRDRHEKESVEVDDINVIRDVDTLEQFESMMKERDEK